MEFKLYEEHFADLCLHTVPSWRGRGCNKASPISKPTRAANLARYNFSMLKPHEVRDITDTPCYRSKSLVTARIYLSDGNEEVKKGCHNSDAFDLRIWLLLATRAKVSCSDAFGESHACPQPDPSSVHSPIGRSNISVLAGLFT